MIGIVCVAWNVHTRYVCRVFKSVCALLKRRLMYVQFAISGQKDAVWQRAFKNEGGTADFASSLFGEEVFFI